LKKIIFACNSSQEEGLGHFIRCFNIATSLHNLNPYLEIYFDGKYCFFALSKIKNHNFNLLNTDSKNWIYKESVVIFDSYLHTQEKIDEFSSKSLFSIKIDDFNLYDLSNVDCIINFRADAQYEKYNSAKNLLGLSYYPAPLGLVNLRKKNITEFKNKKVKDIKRFLVFIGGNDKNNNAKRIIEELDKTISGKEFLWVTKKIEKKEIFLSKNTLQILTLQRDISSILNNVDAVICGGGLMKYDSGFSLLPCGSISQTIDQEIDSKICDSKNLICNFGMHNEITNNHLKESIMKFLDNSYQIKLKQAQVEEYYTDSNNILAKEIISFCQ